MIKEAAIIRNDVMYTGRRHNDCFKKAYTTGNILGEDVQGFVTDEGKFVTREEAAIIALECGQIKELKFSETKLFSEDLY